MSQLSFNKNEFIKVINKFDIISFDVFDTLLLRPFARPTDLFWYMENVLKSKGFARARILAERELRERLYNNEEVLLKDIHAKMQKYLETCIQEMDFEEKLLFPNEEMLEIFNIALKKGKKVIIISDTYLPEYFLAKMLDKNGFRGYSKLYVSSTWGKVKWTGSLYHVVLNDLNVSPKIIMHIGDNLEADYNLAKSLGINATYYPKVLDSYMNVIKSNVLCDDIEADDHMYSFLLMNIANRSRYKYKEYWQKFGYEIAGPVCYAYTKFIAKIINEHTDISGIAFVARDGYLIKKTYDKLFINNKIKSRYVYASRSLNLLYRLDYDTSYAYSLPQMKTILKHYNLQLKNKINVENLSHNEANDLIQSNLKIIKQYADKGYEEYKNYLKYLELGTGTVLLIDTITDKFSAQKLISNSIPNKVIGVYWLIYQSAINNSNKNLFISFQKEHYDIIKTWNLMEFILTAPEPPVKIMKNGKPKFFNANSFENKRISIFSEMEKGIDEFVDNISKTPFINMEFDNRTITRWINNFLTNPNSDDRKAFESVFFSSKPDHSDIISLNPFMDMNYKDEILNEKVISMSLKQRIKSFIKRIFKKSYRRVVERFILEFERNFMSSIRYEFEESRRMLNDRLDVIQDKLDILKIEMKQNELNSQQDLNLKVTELKKLNNEKLSELMISINTELNELMASTNIELNELIASTNTELSELNASINKKLSEIEVSIKSESNDVKKVIKNNNSRLYGHIEATDNKLVNIINRLES